MTNATANRDGGARFAVLLAMLTLAFLRRLAPLRPVDRVVAGYATSAFALVAGDRLMLREWTIGALGVVMSAAGVVLLVHDHRRWRAERPAGRRARPRSASPE
jgi:hypothetical protein